MNFELSRLKQVKFSTIQRFFRETNQIIESLFKNVDTSVLQFRWERGASAKNQSCLYRAPSLTLFSGTYALQAFHSYKSFFIFDEKTPLFLQIHDFGHECTPFLQDSESFNSIPFLKQKAKYNQLIQ